MNACGRRESEMERAFREGRLIGQFHRAVAAMERSARAPALRGKKWDGNKHNSRKDWAR